MTVTALGLPSPTRPTVPAPRTGPLVDTFGRIATDLRVSLTDRCNLRCEYCMPEENYVWLPREDLLHFEEISHLVDVFVGLGVMGAPMASHLANAGYRVALYDVAPQLAQQLALGAHGIPRPRLRRGHRQGQRRSTMTGEIHGGDAQWTAHRGRQADF